MQHVSHRLPQNRMAAMAILAAAFGTPAHAAHPLLTEDTGTQGEASTSSN
ncbi:MAG: hypothetical protein H6952_09235 [Zoogloeaceae bacterium]|nr:hypothetical protein [Zoogloeaceae bacterium]